MYNITNYDKHISIEDTVNDTIDFLPKNKYVPNFDGVSFRIFKRGVKSEYLQINSISDIGTVSDTVNGDPVAPTTLKGFAQEVVKYFYINPGISIANQVPSLVQTPKLAEFEALKFGWFILWNMETEDAYTSYGSAAPNAVAAPETFTYAGSDVTGWADAALAVGNVDYAVLTTKWNRGFHLWASNIKLNKGSQFSGEDSYNASIDLPQYEPYGVNHPNVDAQRDILTQFVNSFKAIGTKVGFYYNLGKDINARGGFDDEVPSSFDGSGNYRDYWSYFKTNGLAAARKQYPSITGDFSQFYRLYTEFVKAELTFLLTHYTIDYLWLDAVAWFPRVELKEIYNLIKSIRKNVLVFHNLPPEGGTIFPTGSIDNPPFTVASDEIYLYQGTDPCCDVISYEHSRVPDGADELKPETSHDGVEYYLPKEVSMNIWDSGWWGWQPAGSLRSAVDLQKNFNSISSGGSSMLLGVPIKPDGSIDSAVATRLSDFSTWTPEELDNKVFWLPMTKANLVYDANGVSQINDKFNTNHFTQSDNSKKPTEDLDSSHHWVDFNGTTDYMLPPNLFNSVYRSAFSFAIRAYPDDGQPTSNNHIFSGTNELSEDLFSVQVRTDGKIRASYRSNGNSVIAETSAAIFEDGVPSAFHAIIVTVDGANIKIFIDGVEATLDGTLDGDMSGITMSEFETNVREALGGQNFYGSFTNFFKGLLGDAIMTSDILTQTEITKLSKYMGK